MPRKKNSRAYSRSLEATNKFFTENSFFAKPKSRKNKVYDPNAKYYEEGGALLTKEVTCKKCGWEWDAADGGKDITTCHKCGGQGLVHAQDGGDYIEAELTPEQIQQYAEGGFIVEDISIPELTKANLGKIVKTARRPVSRTLITPPHQRGVTTYLPIEQSTVDLRNMPIDFDVKQLKYPLTIAGESGYFSVYPNHRVEDNIFHFATKMTNPMEAGRAMKLVNDSFPQAFPSILEPHSLSLDSYNLLLNMAKEKTGIWLLKIIFL